MDPVENSPLVRRHLLFKFSVFFDYASAVPETHHPDNRELSSASKFVELRDFFDKQATHVVGAMRVLMGCIKLLENEKTLEQKGGTEGVRRMSSSTSHGVCPFFCVASPSEQMPTCS